MKFRRTRIAEPYVHGWTYSTSNPRSIVRSNTAQVARAYASQWLCFPHRDGKQVQMGKRNDGREYIGLSEAIKEAKDFIAGTALPYEFPYGKAIS